MMDVSVGGSEGKKECRNHGKTERQGECCLLWADGMYEICGCEPGLKGAGVRVGGN